MLVVRKNKGSTMIEAIESLFIITITIVTVASIFSSNIKVRRSTAEVTEAIYFMEGLKKILLCNYTYEEIKDSLVDKEIYVDNESVRKLDLYKVDIVKNKQNNKQDYPSIKIIGSEGQGGTIKITMLYYLESNNAIENVFYKGNYEQVR